MVKKKRHSRAEIATKLVQANEMATQGKLQSEIARALGYSHDFTSVAQSAAWTSARISGDDPRGERARPHARRRRPNCRTPARKFTVAGLVTDVLLEKIKLEEAAQSQRTVA
jgi:hypothetical protein